MRDSKDKNDLSDKGRQLFCLKLAIIILLEVSNQAVPGLTDALYCAEKCVLGLAEMLNWAKKRARFDEDIHL